MRMRRPDCGRPPLPVLVGSLVVVLLTTVAAKLHEPFTLRMSCGARHDTRTPSSKTLWSRDFGYTGGKIANATRTSFIAPSLKTVRYFPLSQGPENCYKLNYIRRGHYQFRIFFALSNPKLENEPLFDVSVEGTQIYSMTSGWSTDDERAFVEAILFVRGSSIFSCFHSTGHGDPSILSLELLQIDDNAYNFGPPRGQGTLLRTVKRLACGSGKPAFDEDYGGNLWGGNRFWKPIKSFGKSSDKSISTESNIAKTAVSPNFYPEEVYQYAIVGADAKPDLSFQMDVEPEQKYFVWLHFAEIDPSITSVGQRVFDVLVNDVLAFPSVDIIRMIGKSNTALVLKKAFDITGKTLTITLQPKNGSHAIINAIEVFQVFKLEFRTIQEEVRALQILKISLGLPSRFGWNGDPCVPQQHPWSGVDCHYNEKGHSWFIDGLGLDNQGLRGVLPHQIFLLRYLQKLNLSRNSIKGSIPYSLGTISRLEILDLSYNMLNGSIPVTLGRLKSLRILNLNGNRLSGRVPASLGGRLLHRASFNFTGNDGLCGIPGLPACGPRLSTGAKVGIAIGALVTFSLIATCITCWWKRRQNILRAQKIAAGRDAPYAKARTNFTRDTQMTKQQRGFDRARSPDREPRLLP